MGERVETLEDLLRPGLRAVCVGINPAPASVKAGHYYQGRLGQAFWTRLRRAGLVASSSGWEDDAAFASGIGFTDIVKRPTASASEIAAGEFEHGRGLLAEKLEASRPHLVIFTFKKTAEAYAARTFVGYGFVRGLVVAERPAFVMPGPYERRDRVDAALAELTQRLA